VAVIDDELARLPEAYRAPLLLCGLQGLARDEAARRLGWSAGAVKGRLERGRELLRRRLEARGLTVPAVFAGVLAADSAGAVPPEVIRTVTRAALAAPAAVGPVKVWVAAAAVLALGVGAGAVGLPRARPDPPAAPPAPAAAAPAVPQPRVDREGVPLPPGVLARLGSSRLRHAGTVFAGAWAPDGKTLASGSDDSVRVWDAATGKLLRHFPVPAGYGQALRYTADGGELVCVKGNDGPGVAGKPPGSVQRFDPISGRELSRAELGGDGPVVDAVISPSGKRVAIGGIGNAVAVHVYDAATGKHLVRIPCAGMRARDLDFAPDEQTIAIADVRDTVRLHDTTDGHLVSELKHEGVKFILARFSPDGRTLATLAGDNGVPCVAELWDVAGRKVRLRLPLPEADAFSTHDISFAPDGKLVATCGQSPDVILWDASTGREVHRFRGHLSVMRTTFSPDGRTLVAASNNGTVQLWDVATGEPRSASADPPIGVYDLRYADGGRRLLGASDRVRAWDPATGRDLRRFPEVPRAYRLTALSPDERLLAGVDTEGVVRLWDAATGREVRALPGGASRFVRNPQFSADGKRLFATDRNKVIRVWDVANGKELHRLTGHNGWADQLVTSPDGRWLATASADRAAGDFAIRLWDLTTYQEVRRFKPRGESAFAVAFSPDSRQLAAGVQPPRRAADRGELQLWDVETGRELRSFEGHTERMTCVAFAPDGRTLATGGVDTTLRLWEVATGSERQRFTGHAGTIHAVAFAPDGGTLAASSPEAPVYVWDVFGLSERPQQPPTAAELEQAWAALAGTDAKAAFQAIRRLVAAPGPAVAFLHDRLPPAAAVDAAHVRELVRRLDSPRFADRQAAAQELERLADRATDLIRAAAKDTASAEVRQTLQRILDRLDAGTPETLRAARAVEALEHAGTPAALAHLKALAGGAADAVLTREAAAALKRLGP
jgi:WD40 repeat protein